MTSKVTVKQIKAAGFKLVASDTVDGVSVSSVQAASANVSNSNCLALDWSVTDFTWRKNTGVQPVADDCPVIIHLEFQTSNGRYKAGCVNWGVSGNPVLEWKPDLEAIAQLDQAQEWKSGDECVCNEKEYTYLCALDGLAVLALKNTPEWDVISVDHSRISKPESPEGKAAREREEAAHDLFRTALSARGVETSEIEENWSAYRDIEKDGWYAIVDKTGYKLPEAE